MGAIEHLIIALSAEKAERVRARVASGDYVDVNAVMEQASAALDALDGEIASTLSKLGDADIEDWLRTEVAIACDEMDRDPSSGIPIEQVAARLRAERLARGE